MRREKEGVIQREKQREKEEGISLYFQSPRSQEGVHPDLAELFEIIEAEKPLTREDIEQEVESFIGQNLEKVVPIFFLSEPNQAEVIQKLGISQEDLRLLGVNYSIQMIDGQPKVCRLEEDSQGDLWFSQAVSASELITLAYAKANIRVDSRFKSPQATETIPRRYYLRSQGRYLCANDFGMKVWDEEEKKMVNGDPANLSPYLSTIKSQVDRIRENIEICSYGLIERFEDELAGSIRQKTSAEYLDYEQNQYVERTAREKAAKEFLQRLSSNPKEKELILTALPYQKFRNFLYFHPQTLVKRLGLSSQDPVSDYHNFERKAPRLFQLVRLPSKEETSGVTINYVYSEWHKKPVITTEEFNEHDINSLMTEVKNAVRDYLARKAIENEDEKIRQCCWKYLCSRGSASPYFYPDWQVYETVKALGVEKTQQGFGY